MLCVIEAIKNIITVFSGCTHRSNQVSAPEYIFLISALSGEQRFASIVAKWLESLGALAHPRRSKSHGVQGPIEVQPGLKVWPPSTGDHTQVHRWAGATVGQV